MNVWLIVQLCAVLLVANGVQQVVGIENLEVSNMVRPLLLGQMGSAFLMQPRVNPGSLLEMPQHPASTYHMQPRVSASNYQMQPQVRAQNYEVQPQVRALNYEMQPDISPDTFEDDLISDFDIPQNFNRPIEGGLPNVQEVRIAVFYLSPERIRFGAPTLFNIVPDDDENGTTTTGEPASTPQVDTTPLVSTTTELPVPSPAHE